MNESAEIQGPREISAPEQIRESLMGEFGRNLDILHPTLMANRAKESKQRQNPLVTVVVSLWEEDETMITTKMFGESLSNLINQAENSGLDLDFIIVANNGGGKTTELGERVVKELEQSLTSTFGDDYFHKITTLKPDQTLDPSTSWVTDIPLSSSRTEGKNRCFLVIQPVDELNKGKIRAIRDTSNALYKNLFDGYNPDAIFQMDAETILEFKPSSLKLTGEPIRVMYDALKRRDGVVAIGTKDHFEVMDPETGKPKGVRMPIAQTAFTRINRGNRENFLYLPGGAILAEPDYYIAGMRAISMITYGSLAEDYMFTQMLREYGKRKGLAGEIVRVNSTDAITHLNRSQQGDRAIKQLLRWKRQANTIDQIFPNSRYRYKPLISYIRMLIKHRLKEAGSKRRFLLEAFADLKQVPGMFRIAFTRKTEDPVGGDSSWGRSKEKGE